MFDVALLTGFPSFGKTMKFNDDAIMTNFGEMVRQRVQQEEEEELRRTQVRSRGRATVCIRTVLLQ